MATRAKANGKSKRIKVGDRVLWRLGDQRILLHVIEDRGPLYHGRRVLGVLQPAKPGHYDERRFEVPEEQVVLAPPSRARAKKRSGPNGGV